MIGVIRASDVLFHPIATIRCFGWRVFFKAVFPWHDKTFLSLLQDARFFEAAAKAPAPLEQCIRLELAAMRIYTAFAEVFAATAPAHKFFEELAWQEQDHADLLEICRSLAAHGTWRADRFARWQEHATRLEQQMQELEASLRSIDDLEIALQVVIRIEASEINQIFRGILAATDAGFVKKIKAFRDAMRNHIAYVCKSIPELAPAMMPACRELRMRFLQA